MSEYVLRRPLNVEARHFESKRCGIYSNYNDQAHPQGLFKERQQWSLLGIYRVDKDEISDLQPYVVIQNPTPFGYLVKQSQYLRSTGPNGQPSEQVPRVYNYPNPIVSKSQAPIAFSTSLMGPTQLIDRDPGPKEGPVVKGDMGLSSRLPSECEPAFVPDMKGTFKRAAEAMVPENRPSKINKRFGTFIPQNQQKQEYDREKEKIQKESKAKYVLTNFSVNPDKINN